MGGARIVEGVGDLDLGDGLPEGKLQEPYYGENERMSSKIDERVPWLLLYRVRGQGSYK
jgi:hypothetical protein